jgi:hypothetical protein
VITEDTKIIQFLVKLARTGKLKPLKNILELKKIIQILVLVTIIFAGIQMDPTDLGVILQIQIIDGSIVLH